MVRFIITVSNCLQKTEEAILSAAILGIAFLTIANVFARTLLGTSLTLAEEVSQFLIIAVTFVGLSYAASLGRHIRMTALCDLLPERSRRHLRGAVQSATALLMFVLGGYACKYVHTVYELGGVYPVTRIPFFVIYLVAPLGFILAGCQFALVALKDARDQNGERNIDQPNQPETAGGG